MARPNAAVIMLAIVCIFLAFPPREWLSRLRPTTTTTTTTSSSASAAVSALSSSTIVEEELVTRIPPRLSGSAVARSSSKNPRRRSTPPLPSASSSFASSSSAASSAAASASVDMDELLPPLMNIHSAGKKKYNYTQKIHDYGWVFKRYISSKLEDDFYEAVGPIETKNWIEPMRKRFRPQFEKLVQDMESRVIPNDAFTDYKGLHRECKQYARDVVNGVADEDRKPSCLSSTQPMDPDIFSRFEYEFRCIDEPCRRPPPPHPAPPVGSTHVSFIEPLAGIMRHPLVFLMGKKPHVVNKSYMIPDKWALNNLHLRYRNQRKKVSHFYDCGASTYTDGAGGASQNWFIGLGDCMCTPFNTMRLWEMEQHAPKRFWRGVPERLHPNYMWYNYPLSADPDSFSNPLNHLVSKVKFGDPVIMKIDFDTPVLELKLIQQIQQTPDVYRRIDEFFFEHHVQIPIMAPIWGQVDKKCFIRCTIDLFKSLRTLGIRAHSWV